MKKLFIFLALTHQGLCADKLSLDYPMGKNLFPYSSMIMESSPSNSDLIISLGQNSLVTRTRPYNPGLTITEQEIDHWMAMTTRRSTTPPAAAPTTITFPATIPSFKKDSSAARNSFSPYKGSYNPEAIYNFTDLPVTSDEYTKLLDLRAFVCSHYLDATGSLLCDQSNAFLGIYNYISEKPWRNQSGVRIIHLLFNYGKIRHLNAYRQIIKEEDDIF